MRSGRSFTLALAKAEADSRRRSPEAHGTGKAAAGRLAVTVSETGPFTSIET
ncbi:MAG: hypothetical protein QOJ05_153 [Verrucomicrobiota bacterium]|jgi:hypothetical protein